MDATAKHTISTLLTRALTSLPADAVDRVPEGWQKKGSQWSPPSRAVSMPDFDAEQLGEALLDALKASHRDHLGLVGIAGLSSIIVQGEPLAMRAMHEILKRSRTMDRAAAVAQLVDELEQFIDSTHLEIWFVAPLTNFAMDTERLRIGDLEVRQLTDQEASLVFGAYGPADSFHRVHRPDYVLTGSATLTKALGPPTLPFPTDIGDFRRKVEAFLIALRLLKAGAWGTAGCLALYFSSARFTLINLGVSSCGFEVDVPLGEYSLREDEVNQLEVLFDAVSNERHQSLDLAIRRLSEACLRRDASDRLLDAVTGLEATLLYKTSQELGYRFGLRYASVRGGSTEEKLVAYKCAKRAYDCRSRIVHGEKPPGSVGATARIAEEMLRTVIKRFLRDKERPPYLGDDYWERLVLGG